MWAFAILIASGVFGATLSSPVVGPNVVGGANATNGEFPFMVSIRSDGWHFCGGSLIAPQWVLTAAHCVQDGLAGLEVYYGDVHLKNSGNLHSAIVVKQITHPNFTNNDVRIRNDVALLKLEQPIIFSDTVKAISLPAQNEAIPENHTAVLTGWGYIDSYADDPEILQKVNLTIFDQTICYLVTNLVFDTTQNICAGTIDNTKGQCNGDSGGPLFINNVQWGIAYRNIEPCISAPGVFTRTSVFVDWIKSVTGI